VKNAQFLSKNNKKNSGRGGGRLLWGYSIHVHVEVAYSAARRVPHSFNHGWKNVPPK